MSTHVVHTVGKKESLRISQSFAELFDTAVYVARHHIHLLDNFTVDGCAQAHYAVGRWVLRTEVHHIIVVAKHLLVNACNVAVLVFLEGVSVVFVYLGSEANRVLFRVGVVVLA